MLDAKPTGLHTYTHTRKQQGKLLIEADNVLKLTLLGQKEIHLCLAMLSLRPGKHTIPRSSLSPLWLRTMWRLLYHEDTAKMIACLGRATSSCSQLDSTIWMARVLRTDTGHGWRTSGSTDSFER